MKNTLVNQDGQSYTQEINARDIDKILDYIKRQTSQHLNLNEDNIPLEVKKQLNQLLDAIDTNSISSQNIDAYLTLWQPLYINTEVSRPTVALTLYFDGDYEFTSYLPASFFDIYEY